MGTAKPRVCFFYACLIVSITICGTILYMEGLELELSLANFIYSVVKKTVHVVVVVSGYEETRNSYLAIKSLLIHRSTNIHFHFVADHVATRALKSIMTTWLLPGVRYNYYDLEHAQKLAIGNKTHHCIESLLVKLNLHLILPDNITEVVVLDSSAIITADILDFEMQVFSMNHSLAFSDAICLLDSNSTETMSLNKLDKHFSGVMFIRLSVIRSSLWKDSWAQAIGQLAAECSEMSPGKVLSAMEVFLLPIANCSWNAYTHASLDAFPDLYWNKVSVFRQQDLVQGPAHLVNIFRAVQNYNGYELRYKIPGFRMRFKDDPGLRRCPTKKDNCRRFQWERKQVRREFPFFLEYSYSPISKYDVTMAVHLDVYRMHVLEQLASHWEGPMSVAILLIDSQVQEFIDFVSNSENLKNRHNITYHLLFNLGINYPINPLRRLAHKRTETPYVFHNDADFIPSFGMYSSVRHKIQNRGSLAKIAMVIPAFDTFVKNLSYPRDKEEMVKLMDNKTVEQFHVRYLSVAHGQTNYEKWKTAKEPYFVKWRFTYEPFVLTETSVFSFDPRFIGRYNDKVSFDHQLQMAGYHFLVSNDDFTIHMPHTKAKFRAEDCKNLLQEFLIEKNKQYYSRRRH